MERTSLFILTIMCLSNGSATKLDNKLLLFLVDGFKWNYLDDGGEYPGFDRLLKNGVKAAYLTPDFPSSSYPNYYSLMTGVHTEKHGMICNRMYDAEHNETFELGTNPEQYHSYWWEDAEPFWVTAEKRGMKTAWYRWPGTEVTIHGTNVSQMALYIPPTVEDMEQNIKSAILDLKGDFDVVGVYIELTDKAGHDYGPDSNETKTAVSQVDSGVTQVLDSLEQEGLTDEVNIVMFSDHGMITIEHVIDISSILNSSEIDRVMDRCAHMFVWPAEGHLEEVYEAFKMFSPNMQVYKKEDIPDRYKIKNHRRVSPILLVADPGYCIIKSLDGVPENGTYGSHGYDNINEHMRGIFLANGPDFRDGYESGPMRVVDVYQLLCHITDITPVQNAGNWEAVKDMLLNSAHTISNQHCYLAVALIGAFHQYLFRL